MSMINVPWDFFHLGLLLVIIMVFITGIVICVAITGVCCFHWLDSSAPSPTNVPRPRKTSNEIREEIIRLDNELNEQMRRFKGDTKKSVQADMPPPSYDALFPNVPQAPLTFTLGSTSQSQHSQPTEVYTHSPLTFNLRSPSQQKGNFSGQCHGPVTYSVSQHAQPQCTPTSPVTFDLSNNSHRRDGLSHLV